MNGRKALPFLLIVGLAVLLISSPVSAYQEIFSEEGYMIGEQTTNEGAASQTVISTIVSADSIEKMQDITFFTYEGSGIIVYDPTNSKYIDSGSVPFSLFGEEAGNINWQTQYNILGQYDKIFVWLNFNDNINEIITYPTNMPFALIDSDYQFKILTKRTIYPAGSNPNVARLELSSATEIAGGTWQVVREPKWENSLTISDSYPYSIQLMRNSDYSEYFRIDEEYNIVVNDYSKNDLNDIVLTRPFTVIITSPSGTNYTYISEDNGESPTTASVITRVKSLSDKSLIAGAKVYYRALDGSDLQNKTLASGSDEFILQKNLEYEYWAEASGYENQTSIPSSSIFTGDTFNDIWLVPTLEDPEEGTGLYNFYISEQTTYTGSSTPLTSPAYVTLNGETKLTTSAGYVSFEVNKTTSISYKIQKDGYVSVSRTYTPNWPGNSINEYIAIRPEGVVLPGEPTAAPTPDHRSTEQKAEGALNIIFDNLEAIATLSVVVLIVCMCDWLTPKGGKRR